ncbi:MAG: peptidase T [Anaerovoracaceae bacterium]
MSNLLERFCKYVKIDTASIEDADVIPSYEGQRDLAEILKTEMEELGLVDVEVTPDCFAFGTLPASEGYEHVKPMGLLAHLDTAPDCVGKNVVPCIHKNYDGGVVVLQNGIKIDPATYPEILQYKGDDIVTSDGTTLLGADDKSGIAIIMTAIEELVNNKEIRHGEIKLAFTPDEEVSVGGASIFDVNKFGVDFGITVDGDGIGTMNYETFNAFYYKVIVNGNNIHPAEAKGKMVNASYIAMEFDGMLPKGERAEYTEGHEGFTHLYEMEGEVESASLGYILRDFEKNGLTEKIDRFEEIAKTLNDKYGEGTIKLEGEYEYSNPKEIVLNKDGLLEMCEEAYRQCGIEPIIEPIRGGTDGSTLADKGLACMNLFMGGHNYHSTREYVSVDAMIKAKEILIKMMELNTKR